MAVSVTIIYLRLPLFLDVNERPVVLCNSSFYISTTSSSGSVVGQVEGYDPDNEKYHKSKISNPNGPFDSLKQELNYRFEPENNSWAFDITLNGVIYLEGVSSFFRYYNFEFGYNVRRGNLS